MKLTTKGRYAVMALADLARFNNVKAQYHLRDISLRQGISSRLSRANFFKIKKR